MEEISVHNLKEKIDAKAPNLLLLDVREPFEQYQSNIEYENTTLIPLGELEDRLNELADQKEQEIVCLCRSGSRSADACQLLEKEGFTNVKNLRGGINQWAKEINPNLPIY